MSAPVTLGLDELTPMAALETIRGLLNRADIAAGDVEDLDELARIRLTLTDLATPIAGLTATIDSGIRRHVEEWQTVTVLDGTRTVTVKPKKSGGSTHWSHSDVARALWPLAEGDVDVYVGLIAECLGKAAPWKSTDLKKHGLIVDQFRTTTATVTGFTVIIEQAVTAS